MTLKHFIPPVFLELRRKLISSSPCYSTYDEALKQCGPGYDSAELARVVVRKTELYRDFLQSQHVFIGDFWNASVATAIGLSLDGTSFNCLDFGGAAGAHYFLAKKILPKSIKLQWHVVETHSMATMAAEKLGGSSLRFFTTIEDAMGAFQASGIQVDLVLSSGALQYVANPEETLAQLTSVKTKRIFITRVGLSDVRLDRRVIVQRSLLSSQGWGALPPEFNDHEMVYPVTFCTKDGFEKTLLKENRIDITFLEKNDAYSIGQTRIPLYGFFGRRLE